MNLTDAAALLGVNPRTLRLTIDRGDIAADHRLAHPPWISRDGLESEPAQALKRRVSHGAHHAAMLDSQQEQSLISTT